MARNKNLQKMLRFHGNQVLNEIFFQTTKVTRYDPPLNKILQQ
jgi:hypothetical protein